MGEKIERLKEWAEGKKVGPLSLEIWPTHRCNLRCKMCGTWAHRKKLEEGGIRYDPVQEMKNEVSEERLLKLIDEAKELGVKECLLTGGGEPFVRKETTIRLMKKIKESGFFGNINTNGTLASEKDVKQIVKMRWDMLMLSIDAPNPEDNDFIRGVKGTFKRVQKTLKLFQSYKKKFKQEIPKIVFNTVLTNRIYDKLNEMIEFASEVGCEDITFIPLIVYDESMKVLELKEKEERIFQENLREAIKFSRELGVDTNLPSLNDKKKYQTIEKIKNSPKDLVHSPCFEPFLHFLVKGNGETTFCCMIENSPENIKNKTMREIWFGNYFNEQRENFINKKIRKECKFCVFSQFIRNREIRNQLKGSF